MADLDKLKDLNEIIIFLEQNGMVKEANKFHNEFIKEAQYTLPYKPATISYSVQPGDGLISIAKKFNTTQEQLYALNPGLSANLKSGTLIKVPKPKGNIQDMFKDIAPYLKKKLKK